MTQSGPFYLTQPTLRDTERRAAHGQGDRDVSACGKDGTEGHSHGGNGFRHVCQGRRSQASRQRILRCEPANRRWLRA
eukprot:1186600-Prorocentrum_minimum.AAC.2